MPEDVDTEYLENRLGELEGRIEALEEYRRQGDGPMVGDTCRVVITDPNADEDKDAFCRIDGMATFVRVPDDYEVEWGESLRVRVADVSETTIVAVAVGVEDA